MTTRPSLSPKFGSMTVSAAVLVLFMGPALVGPALANGPYADKTLADAATSYTVQLTKSAVNPAKRAVRDIRLDAEKLLATPNGDARVAVNGFMLAVGLETTDYVSWLGLANALLAIKPEAMKSGEQTALPDQARWAAYRAYELAKTPVQKAVASSTFCRALQG